jgi:hypothetical protein
MEETRTEVTQETYPLDDAAIETIAMATKQTAEINLGVQAVLNYFLRQHKLKGNWRVAENGKELVLDVPAKQ